MRASARHAPPTRYRSRPAASASHGTPASSASTMARARNRSPPDRSARRMTPRRSVAAAPRWPRSSRTSSSEPPPMSARIPSALGNAAQHAGGGQCRLLLAGRGCGSARPAYVPARSPRSPGRSSASRTAAVASTSNGLRPHGARDGADSGSSPSAPAPLPSSFSRPVDCSPRPSRSTAFSLNIATGLRPRPSNTTRRTELEPRSTTAQRGRSAEACRA